MKMAAEKAAPVCEVQTGAIFSGSSKAEVDAPLPSA